MLEVALRPVKETEEKEVLLKTNLTGRQSPSFKLSFSGATKANLTSQSTASSLPGSPTSPGSPGSVSKSTPQTTAITTKGGLVGLVDYPDDDEEEEDDDEEEKEETLPLAKKQRLGS
ncbi:Hypothetical predicted protein [Pelobates cultripes]|uniref:Uncharacterized protein n=1 Tax=Pelobates cultripes TaxID=61616 RepID=A0AAD1TJF0_PELCU|nr:Hypothetical predicted protein [Pelobates cultripes]